MCYIVFIRYSLHWCYIKIALLEYVINTNEKLFWHGILFVSPYLAHEDWGDVHKCIHELWVSSQMNG